MQLILLKVELYPYSSINPRLIIISGGICNVTSKQGSTKVSLADTPEALVSDVSDIVETVELKFNVVTKAKRMYLPMIGMLMHKYNGEESEDVGQKDLNKTVIGSNRILTNTNESNGVPTPFVQSQFHKCMGNGRFIHRYDWLIDGLHYSTIAQQQMAYELEKTVRKYFSLPPISKPNCLVHPNHKLKNIPYVPPVSSKPHSRRKHRGVKPIVTVVNNASN